MVHIPTLFVRFYHVHMVFKLQEFGDEYEFHKPDLQSCFEIYHAVREFKEMVEQVDFKISDNMKIEEWFKPMLLDWLDSAGKAFW